MEDGEKIIVITLFSVNFMYLQRILYTMKNGEYMQRFLEKKSNLVCLTAYDYCTAKIMDGIVDLILVGDSLAMVMLGHKDTKKVSMFEMLHHTKAVAAGAHNTLIVGDMPINTYNTKEDALLNAKLFIEAGAHGVKIEGNKPEIVKALVSIGIPVMGHIGVTPQTFEVYKVQGKDKVTARKLLDEALSLEKAGCFSIVLECVATSTAKMITEKLKIPTIGIGAGKYCKGQILVVHDMLGLYTDFKPKFVKKYANLAEEMKTAFLQYRKEVEEGIFPSEKESYS